MMKRLFMLRNQEGKPFTTDGKSVLYFDSKLTAKSERDALNKETPGVWEVSRGPDHWREQS